MMRNPQQIINQINSLLLQSNDFIGNRDQILKKANQLSEMLLCITKETYDRLCENYAETRGDDPYEFDKKWLRYLLKIAKRRAKSGLLGNDQGGITLLDVGTGSERDINYITTILGIKVIAIDNSDGVIMRLKVLEKVGKIPVDSICKSDMRDLSKFQDDSFDIVRYNASLLHLPVIGNGYMADLALKEGYRVVKKNGLIFINVKEGKGLKIIDTNEGLGSRIYQLHTMESMQALVQRNNFSILILKQMKSPKKREGDLIVVVAEKI